MTKDFHEDPTKADPRFPGRPTHPDFVRLSEAVQEMDRKADVLRVPIPEITGVDTKSLTYLMDNRLGIASQRLGMVTSTTGSAIKSIWMDAFTLGKHYAEAQPLWYLTVDDDSAIVTTHHRSQAACIEALRTNYDADGQWADVPDNEIIQTLIDMQGLVIYMDEVAVEGTRGSEGR